MIWYGEATNVLKLLNSISVVTWMSPLTDMHEHLISHQNELDILILHLK